MKRILYSGISKDGRKRYGFVEAASNKEAFVNLKKEELNNIELHEDVFMALNRDDLEKLSKKQTEFIAEFEIKSRSGKTILKKHLRVYSKLGLLMSTTLVESTANT